MSYNYSYVIVYYVVLTCGLQIKQMHITNIFNQKYSQIKRKKIKVIFFLFLNKTFYNYKNNSNIYKKKQALDIPDCYGICRPKLVNLLMLVFPAAIKRMYFECGWTNLVFIVPFKTICRI